MSSSSIRQRKVSTQVLRILGQMLVSESNDERFSLATITEVVMSPDLGYAKVYVSIQQPSTDPTITSEKSFEIEILDALNKASAWFQRGLNKELRLRKTPKVSFMMDTSAQHYSEIDALLKKVL